MNRTNSLSEVLPFLLTHTIQKYSPSLNSLRGNQTDFPQRECVSINKVIQMEVNNRSK